MYHALKIARNRALIESIDYHLRYMVAKSGEEGTKQDVLHALATV